MLVCSQVPTDPTSRVPLRDLWMYEHVRTFRGWGVHVPKPVQVTLEPAASHYCPCILVFLCLTDVPQYTCVQGGACSCVCWIRQTGTCKGMCVSHQMGASTLGVGGALSLSLGPRVLGPVGVCVLVCTPTTGISSQSVLSVGTCVCRMEPDVCALENGYW